MKKKIEAKNNQKIEEKKTKQLHKYIAIEVGSSAYTEFLMYSGNFEKTEDGIFLGSVFAESEEKAVEGIQNLPSNAGRVFDRILVFRVKD